MLSALLPFIIVENFLRTLGRTGDLGRGERFKRECRDGRREFATLDLALQIVREFAALNIVILQPLAVLTQ
jgi:hypothetical protein